MLAYGFFVRILKITAISTKKDNMTINTPQVAINIDCVHVVFKIVDSKDAVIKAT